MRADKKARSAARCGRIRVIIFAGPVIKTPTARHCKQKIQNETVSREKPKSLTARSRIRPCVRPYPPVDFVVFRPSPNLQHTPTDALGPRSGSNCSRALLFINDE